MTIYLPVGLFGLLAASGAQRGYGLAEHSLARIGRCGIVAQQIVVSLKGCIVVANRCICVGLFKHGGRYERRCRIASAEVGDKLYLLLVVALQTAHDCLLIESIIAGLRIEGKRLVVGVGRAGEVTAVVKTVGGTVVGVGKHTVVGTCCDHIAEIG